MLTNAIAYKPSVLICNMFITMSLLRCFPYTDMLKMWSLPIKLDGKFIKCVSD